MQGMSDALQSGGIVQTLTRVPLCIRFRLEDTSSFCCSYFTVQPVVSPSMSQSQELEHLLPLSEYQVVARAVVRGEEGPLTLYSDTVYFNTADVYLVQVLRCRFRTF